MSVWGQLGVRIASCHPFATGFYPLHHRPSVPQPSLEGPLEEGRGRVSMRHTQAFPWNNSPKDLISGLLRWSLPLQVTAAVGRKCPSPGLLVVWSHSIRLSCNRKRRTGDTDLHVNPTVPLPLPARVLQSCLSRPWPFLCPCSCPEGPGSTCFSSFQVKITGRSEEQRR